MKKKIHHFGEKPTKIIPCMKGQKIELHSFCVFAVLDAEKVSNVYFINFFQALFVGGNTFQLVWCFFLYAISLQ